jgi:hypothetical protein
MKTGKINLKWSDINMAELDLTKLISHFAQSNKAEGKSPKTVSWYTEMLFSFVRYLRSKGREAILAELNVVTAREFIISEQGRGISPFTVQCKVRSCSAKAPRQEKPAGSWVSLSGPITAGVESKVACGLSRPIVSRNWAGY